MATNPAAETSGALFRALRAAGAEAELAYCFGSRRLAFGWRLTPAFPFTLPPDRVRGRLSRTRGEGSPLALSSATSRRTKGRMAP